MWVALSQGWTLDCLRVGKASWVLREQAIWEPHISLCFWLHLLGLAACTPALTSQWWIITKPETPFPPSAAFSQGVCDGNRNETRTVASCSLLLLCHLLDLFEQFYQNHKVFAIETAETNLSELQGSERSCLNRFGILWQSISASQGALLAWSQRVGAGGLFWEPFVK